MKALVFSKRNLKEIVRDPLSLIFGVGLPIIMLCLFCVISSSVDSMPSMFGAGEMAPSMATFGLSFLTLFLSLLMANDNNNSFLTRLLASPMKTSDFILGYALPMLPLALAQSILCLAVGAAFGMKIKLPVFVMATMLFSTRVVMSVRSQPSAVALPPCKAALSAKAYSPSVKETVGIPACVTSR